MAGSARRLCASAALRRWVLGVSGGGRLLRGGIHWRQAGCYWRTLPPAAGEFAAAAPAARHRTGCRR